MTCNRYARHISAFTLTLLLFGLLHPSQWLMGHNPYASERVTPPVGLEIKSTSTSEHHGHSHDEFEQTLALVNQNESSPGYHLHLHDAADHSHNPATVAAAHQFDLNAAQKLCADYSCHYLPPFLESVGRPPKQTRYS